MINDIEAAQLKQDIPTLKKLAIEAIKNDNLTIFLDCLKALYFVEKKFSADKTTFLDIAKEICRSLFGGTLISNEILFEFLVESIRQGKSPYKITEYLLKNTPSDNINFDINKFLQNGYNLLMEVAQFGNEPVLSLLLAREDIQPNYINQFGDTALSCAFHKNQLGTFKLLLADKRVNPSLPENRNHLLMDWARFKARDDVVKLLPSRGQEWKETRELTAFRHRANMFQETAHLIGLDAALCTKRPELISPISITIGGLPFWGVSLLLGKIKTFLHKISGSQGPRLITHQQEFKEHKDTKDVKEHKDTKDVKESKDNQEANVRIALFNQIAEAIQATENYLRFEESQKTGAEKLAKIFEANNLVIVMCTISTHSAALALYKDHLIYCNRGMNHTLKLGTHVYKIKDKSKITPEFFIALHRPDDLSMEAIESTILSVVESSSLILLPSKSHRHKTCVVVNLKSAFEGILFVMYFERTGNVSLSMEYAERDYKYLTTFLRDDQLEKLLHCLRQSDNQSDRTFFIDIVVEMLRRHHSEERTPASNEIQRKFVTRLMKVQRELARERRALEFLEPKERADMIAKLDKETRNGLLLPALSYHDEALALLLIQNGAVLNRTDSNNNTSLILAAKAGMVKVVELLLKAGLNINYKNNQQKTALNIILETNPPSQNQRIIAKMLGHDIEAAQFEVDKKRIIEARFGRSYDLQKNGKMYNLFMVSYEITTHIHEHASNSSYYTIASQIHARVSTAYQTANNNLEPLNQFCGKYNPTGEDLKRCQEALQSIQDSEDTLKRLIEDIQIVNECFGSNLAVPSEIINRTSSSTQSQTLTTTARYT